MNHNKRLTDYYSFLAYRLPAMFWNLSRSFCSLLPVLVFVVLVNSAAEKMYGQNAVQQTPDCIRYFNFQVIGNVIQPVNGVTVDGAGHGNGVALANYGTGSPDGPSVCTDWRIGYASTTGISALSLLFQSAPSSATENTPGTFVSYAGTLSTGINPNTNATGNGAESSFTNVATGIPWVRMQLTSAVGTGFVFGVMEGWNEGNGGGGGGGGGCPGTVGTPCVVAGVNSGTAIAMQVDSAGRIIPDTGACQTNATNPPVNSSIPLTTGSGLLQIVAASAGKVITVCHISVGLSAADTFALEYGTGSNCGTGTTVIGQYAGVAGLALDVPFSLPASQALCVNPTVSVTYGGLVIYAQN